MNTIKQRAMNAEEIIELATRDPRAALSATQHLMPGSVTAKQVMRCKDGATAYALAKRATGGTVKQVMRCKDVLVARELARDMPMLRLLVDNLLRGER